MDNFLKRLKPVGIIFITSFFIALGITFWQGREKAPLPALPERTAEVFVVEPNPQGKILFDSKGSANQNIFYEIYSMNPDGSDIKQLTSNDTEDYSAFFSPDGQEIVFVRRESDNLYDIWLMKSDASDQKKFLDTNSARVTATFSPDSQKLAINRFVSDANNNLEIIDKDGANYHPILTNWSVILVAYWSRDNKIYFAGMNQSQNMANMDIWRINPDGSGLEKINAGNDGQDWWPQTCNNNDYVFFGRLLGNNNFEIFRINKDGSGLIQLTNNPAEDSSPACSPDSQRIAFRSNRDGNIFNIYTMALDGSDVRKITNAPAGTSQGYMLSDWSSTEYVRPDLCQSTTLDSADLKNKTIAPGETVNVTSTSKEPAKVFNWAFYNSDNLYPPPNGTPKPICVPGTGGNTSVCPSGSRHLVISETLASGQTSLSRAFNYNDIFVNDLNWGGQKPTHVQINGYFQREPNSPWSLPQGACVVRVNQGAGASPSPSPSPAGSTCFDLDNNGTVDIKDIVYILTRWGQHNDALNRDYNIYLIIDILTNWGENC